MTAQRAPITEQKLMPTEPEKLPAPTLAYSANYGEIYSGDSLQLLRNRKLLKPGTVDLIMTSPPFGLVRKKEYGNVDAEDYVAWFRPFAREFYTLLADNGSLVIDIGGAWIPNQPTRSLYHYELLIMLCKNLFRNKERHFHLAQEFFWWNPSRLPTPAEWVNVRRVRVKDAVNTVWWLSKTPWPKASNLRVLQPYSDSMKELLDKGYTPKLRPSGHDISDKFGIDNGASIPPNLLAIANTESNSAYLKYCTEHHIDPHPARYPATLPEFFIRMTTDPGNLVVDPFAGSCVTGEVSERLKRRWVCCELREDYVEGARSRFPANSNESSSTKKKGTPSLVQPKLLANGNSHGDQSEESEEIIDPAPVRLDEDSGRFFKLPRPGLLWNSDVDSPLPLDGGRTRPTRSAKLKQGDVNAEKPNEMKDSNAE